MAVIDKEIKEVVLYVGSGITGFILVLWVFRRLGKDMKKRFTVWFMNRLGKAVSKKVRNEKAILFDSMTELRDKHNRDLVICEIGSGSGMNFKHYPRGSSLICVEPNPYAKSYVEENILLRNPSLELKSYVCGFAENMSPIDDSSVDVVVCTLVLCSVKSQTQVLSEVLRILRPGGQFYFMEHVADRPRTFRRKMQNWFSPAWHVIADRCRLNSNARAALDEAGFTSVRITDFTFPSWFWLIRPWLYGVATK